MSNQAEIPKILVIRLSSLGDVVFATACLETKTAQNGVEWLVAQEFAALLEGHPRVKRIWRFDRKAGLQGLLTTARRLWTENFTEVYDLHLSLRSRILRLLFFYWSWQQWRKGPKWRSITKTRFRLMGLYLFKRWMPKRFRPRPWVERYAHALNGTGAERPNLRHLLSGPSPMPEIEQRPYLCVMPSSLWLGKQWRPERYLKCIKGLPLVPVILGTRKDAGSMELIDLLQAARMPFVSGIGQWSLPEVARVLARAVAYLGNDTGLAYLAESVGTRAYVVFGPTDPDMGFGPWLTESRAIASDLWCRPCSKDGSACFRIKRKFLCLDQIRPDDVQGYLVRQTGKEARIGTADSLFRDPGQVPPN